jgi:DNA-binding transcriptional ArsR family regulator
MAARGRRLSVPAAAHDHRERIERVRRTMLGDEEIRGLSDIFRLLGEPTRLRILQALAGGEMCVYDLARGLEMSPSAISHQLRLLRALRLVRNRKQGREVYYAVDDEHVVHLMAEVLGHLRHGREGQ